MTLVIFRGKRSNLGELKTTATGKIVYVNMTNKS